jgi:hypothetical protein
MRRSNALKQAQIIPFGATALQNPSFNGDLGSARLSTGRAEGLSRSSTHTVATTPPQHRKAVTMRLTPLNTTDMSAADSDLITTEELARLLRVDPSSVRRWRTARPLQGPPFIQLSERVIMYAMEDVREWLASRRVRPEAA